MHGRCLDVRASLETLAQGSPQVCIYNIISRTYERSGVNCAGLVAPLICCWLKIPSAQSTSTFADTCKLIDPGAPAAYTGYWADSWNFIR